MTCSKNIWVQSWKVKFYEPRLMIQINHNIDLAFLFKCSQTWQYSVDMDTGANASDIF